MDVFISYCEKDSEVAVALATALEEAGYTTWYYERDSLPGLSYLDQILEALEASKALLLVVSEKSMASDQVDMEVVEAHEASMPIYAVLRGLDHRTFKQERRAWAAMLRGNVSIPVTLGDVPAVAPRLAAGLRGRGILPAAGDASPGPSKRPERELVSPKEPTRPSVAPGAATTPSAGPARWYRAVGGAGGDVDIECTRCDEMTCFSPRDGERPPERCPKCGFGPSQDGPAESSASKSPPPPRSPLTKGGPPPGKWYGVAGYDGKDVDIVCNRCKKMSWFRPADGEQPPPGCPECGFDGLQDDDEASGSEPSAGVQRLDWHLPPPRSRESTDLECLECSGTTAWDPPLGEPPPEACSRCGFRGQVALGMELVDIAPGTFQMGSPFSEPGRVLAEQRHEVTLTRAFRLAATPVTQSQWALVMGDNPSRFSTGGEDRPVENVTWYDAVRFCNRLNRLEGLTPCYSGTDASTRWDPDARGYRLPSEAEWEYAARAGTTTPFHTGDCLTTDAGNFNGRYPMEGCARGLDRREPLPVATFPPNPWGLYDMHGTVWEWVWDVYRSHGPGPATDPTGPEPTSVRGHTKRIVRGGSWATMERWCRSAFRSFCPSNLYVMPEVERFPKGSIGFRVARSSPA